MRIEEITLNNLADKDLSPLLELASYALVAYAVLAGIVTLIGISIFVRVWRGMSGVRWP